MRDTQIPTVKQAQKRTARVSGLQLPKSLVAAPRYSVPFRKKEKRISPPSSQNRTQRLKINEFSSLKPYLHLIEPTEQMISLEQSELVIVRKGFETEPHHISIDHPSISQSHCKLALMEQSILVTDLGSTNGTLIRNESGDVLNHSTMELKESDFLILGSVILQFIMKQSH